jgi:hypothetical protein
MRCIHSFLPSNLAGYKSNNSCSAITHTDAQKRAAHGCIPIRTVLEKPALAAERVKPRSRPWNASTTALFVTAFLLMHVQGNQKLLVCLEEKQSCRRTEQRKQLAHEVPDQLAANATGTHRGRLYTARASPRFPVWFVTLAHFMRLSLTKAAHAAWSGAAYRKSGSEAVTGSFMFGVGSSGTF